MNKILTRAPVSLGPMSAEGVAERAGSAGRGAVASRIASSPGSVSDCSLGWSRRISRRRKRRRLRHLSSMLARFPGRKSVILFSEGLAVSPRMDGVLSQAQDENVTFYTLDATGLGAGRAASRCRAERSTRGS